MEMKEVGGNGSGGDRGVAVMWEDWEGVGDW